MRWDIIILRWLPLSIVLAACYMLVRVARTDIEVSGEDKTAELAIPASPKVYVLPVLPRDPLVFGEVVVVKAAVQTSNGVVVPPKKVDPSEFISVNAIFWDPAAPMA
ncbi:MAG: hypothetical protein WCS77_07060, partial [Elusimicrobiaceae bacterium]